jgi:hypothetical protein
MTLHRASAQHRAHAASTHLLCTFRAPPMQVLCSFYAPSSPCAASSCRAPSRVRSFHAASMHLLCSFYAPSSPCVSSCCRALLRACSFRGIDAALMQVRSTHLLPCTFRAPSLQLLRTFLALRFTVLPRTIAHTQLPCTFYAASTHLPCSFYAPSWPCAAPSCRAPSHA